ncbi:MAG: hypothetical protein RIR26_747 [Pseudomonadota bacterium]|jgi:predicted nucleotidyltransferase
MDLSQKHRELIVATITSVLGQTDIFLFGSFARCKARSDSDVDIAIRTGTEIPFEKMMRLKHLFAESDLPFFVDLVDLNAIDESFRSSIQDDFVELARRVD